MAALTQMPPRAGDSGGATPGGVVLMQEQPSAKRCTKCGETKPLEAFYRNRRNRDGRQVSCKACDRAYKRANPEKKRDQERRWRARHPEVARAIGKRSREKRREQIKETARRASVSPAGRARAALARAIKRGDMVRPDVCEDCGQCPETVLHGHHPDHSKQLEVEWLCNPCHAKRHRQP
jgi:hypothetical protein